MERENRKNAENKKGKEVRSITQVIDKMAAKEKKEEAAAVADIDTQNNSSPEDYLTRKEMGRKEERKNGDRKGRQNVRKKQFRLSRCPFQGPPGRVQLVLR